MDARTRTGFRIYSETQRLLVDAGSESQTVEAGETAFLPVTCTDPLEVYVQRASDGAILETHELLPCPTDLAEPTSAALTKFTSGPGEVLSLETGLVAFKSPAVALQLDARARLQDPDELVRGVDFEFTTPGGRRHVIRAAGSPQDSVFTAGGPFVAWSSVCASRCLGTWSIGAYAFDHDGNVVAARERLVEVKDHTEIRTPRVVDLRPVGGRTHTTTRRLDDTTATAELTGRFVVTVRDPDQTIVRSSGVLRSTSPRGNHTDSWSDIRLRREEGRTLHSVRMTLHGELGCHTIRTRGRKWRTKDWYGRFRDGGWTYGKVRVSRGVEARMCFKRP